MVCNFFAARKGDAVDDGGGTCTSVIKLTSGIDCTGKNMVIVKLRPDHALLF